MPSGAHLWSVAGAARAVAVSHHGGRRPVLRLLSSSSAAFPVLGEQVPQLLKVCLGDL